MANFFRKPKPWSFGLCTLIAVKYWPGATTGPSVLPQTNLTAYWKTGTSCAYAIDVHNRQIAT